MAGIQGVLGSITAGTAIANAFLVFLQKVNYDVKGDDNVGFLFNYRGEDTVELKSDITDHYSEGNSALQDHIALAPEKITLRGYIGELSDQLPGILSEVQLVASQLTVLSPFVPQLTAQALQTYNQAAQIYNTAASAVATLTQAFDLITGKDFQTKQQKAFGYFYAKWQNRALFTVQTPWAIFQNMAIESLRAVQDEESNMITDFNITFKKMRFASTISQTSTIVQGRLSSQAASQVSQGAQNPPNVGTFTPGGDNSGVLTA